MNHMAHSPWPWVLSSVEWLHPAGNLAHGCCRPSRTRPDKCSERHLVYQMQSIVVSLMLANGFLVVFHVLSQTLHDVSPWSILERNPYICQFFSIIHWALLCIATLNCCLNVFQFNMLLSKVGTLIFGSLMPLLIPCAGGRPVLSPSNRFTSRLRSKKDFSRADCWSSRSQSSCWS